MLRSTHLAIVAMVTLAFPVSLAACEHDYQVLLRGGADGGSMDSAIDGAPGETGPADSSRGDSAVPDSAPVSDANADADANADGDVAACLLGEACCPGGACGEGACLRGTCVTFGGAYQVDADDGCSVPNPLATGCGCPAGFVDQALYPTDARRTPAGELETLHVCRSATDVPGADFRGAYGRRVGMPPDWCVALCVENPFTESCGCPVGVPRAGYYSAHLNLSTEACQRESVLCHDDAASALTFGGLYHEFVRGIDAECDAETETFARCGANRITGECACPAGFNETRYPVMKIDFFGLADDPLAACPAELAICWRLPP